MNAPLPASDNGSIGSAAIVPAAEPVSGAGVASVSGSQERDFFDQGKADYDYKTAQANLGVMGRFFGRDNGVTYIVGIIVLLALVGLICTVFCAASPQMSDGQKILGSIVTTGLGFFAGSATKK